MVDTKGIKNIFFDLGGVLLNIDFKKTFDAFEALGIENAHQMNDRPKVLELFLDLECGLYDEKGFWKEFNNLVVTSHRNPGGSWDLSEQEIPSALVDAFNALLLDFPPERIELVKKLRKKYRCFLLSNTNAIHAKCYNARLKKNFGIENLDHLMEKAFYSHDLGFRKPNDDIYLEALQMAGAKAEETLFIDDLEENVKAAEALGIRTALVSDEYTIVDLFGEV